MRVSIIGAGGWGTALSIQASTKNSVILWVYSEDEARPIRDRRVNEDYLPGINIPESIEVTTDVEKATKSDILIFSVPTKFFRGVVKKFKEYIVKNQIVVSASKGFEYPSEMRMSEILKEEIPQAGAPVVISGPSHAEEVAREVPTSVVAASYDENKAEVVQKVLSTESFRLYRNNDVVGVEISAAVKNVIAIAAGIVRGLGFGDNTMAALITRGLAEIKRFGLKMGAKNETFLGLAGAGDLIVTCISHHSRNGRVGEELAKGKNIQQILASTKMVAEGVDTVKSIVNFEKEYNIEMPISHAVYDIIYNQKKPYEALKGLMTRPLKNEFE